MSKANKKVKGAAKAGETPNVEIKAKGASASQVIDVGALRKSLLVELSNLPKTGALNKKKAIRRTLRDKCGHRGGLHGIDIESL